MAGFKIENEPRNKKIGKSGLEGKSDLAVKWNDKWIYFEVTRKFWGPMVSDRKITDIATLINEQIKKQDLVLPRTKIEATIIDKSIVFSKHWITRFLEHLGKSSFKLNISKHFDGIQYIVNDRAPDQDVFLFVAPITNAKRSFNITMKKESKQIPENMNGVIVINLDLGFYSYVRYAKETIKNNKFSNILAIIIWYEDDYKIVSRENIPEDFLKFLQIPFSSSLLSISPLQQNTFTFPNDC
jgi:hypothetical protein